VSGPPVRTRSFVMVLVGWMALASAAVVALSAPAIAAFAVLAIGLVAVTTLSRSMRWGAAVSVASLFVFALAGVAGPFPPWALGPDDLGHLLGSLIRWQTLAPDLLAAVALAGTAVCAELASAGLEWDLVLRGAVGRRRQGEDLEPTGTGRKGTGNGAGPQAERRPRPARHQEEA
jgi:hypothetical protein